MSEHQTDGLDAAAFDATKEITHLTERNAELEGLNKKLRGENRIKGEFMRTRQCPDHSGKWERGRCLQCEIEELQAECERLKSPGAMGRLLEECEREQKRADQLQAKLDAAKNIADEMNCEEWCCTSVTKGTPDRCDVCRIQQALNAHETA